MILVGYKKGRKIDVSVLAIGLGFYLQAEAARAFLQMRDDAKTSGIVLKVNTAFRSMGHQKLLRKRYDDYQAAIKAGKKAEPVAYAAKPGYSNHQSGLSVDINRCDGDDPKTKAADSPTDKWLAANAYKYGFINDVSTEPWHWTYYGKPDNGAEA